MSVSNIRSPDYSNQLKKETYKVPEKEKIFDLPPVILAIVLVFILLQICQFSEEMRADIMRLFAFIPAHLTVILDQSQLHAVYITAQTAGAEQAIAAKSAFLTKPIPWSILTYCLVHASWAHTVLNTFWFLAFGTPVARRFGPVRFIALFCASGALAALSYWLVHPFGVIPMVGASGAISGVIAAASRFVFTEQQTEMFRLTNKQTYAPAPPMVALFKNERALAFIIFWLVINVFVGFGSGLSTVGGVVAWEAHVGGFLAGFALFWLLDPVACKKNKEE